MILLWVILKKAYMYLTGMGAALKDDENQNITQMQSAGDPGTIMTDII